jgi:hypothetical protein
VSGSGSSLMAPVGLVEASALPHDVPGRRSAPSGSGWPGQTYQAVFPIFRDEWHQIGAFPPPSGPESPSSGIKSHAGRPLNRPRAALERQSRGNPVKTEFFSQRGTGG